MTSSAVHSSYGLSGTATKARSEGRKCPPILLRQSCQTANSENQRPSCRWPEIDTPLPCNIYKRHGIYCGGSTKRQFARLIADGDLASRQVACGAEEILSAACIGISARL
jgi:hypothetical protein